MYCQQVAETLSPGDAIVCTGKKDVFCAHITPQMPLSNFFESIKNNETDHAEGGLFLCESDLISTFLASHYSTSAQAAPVHTPDVAGALFSMNGQLAVAAF